MPSTATSPGFFENVENMRLICLILMIVCFVYFSYKVITLIKSQEENPNDKKISRTALFSILAQQVRSLPKDEPIPNSGPSILVFVTYDCPTCAVLYTELCVFSRMLPYLLKEGQEIPVLRLEGTEHEELAAKHGIDLVPTICLFDKGEYVEVVDELGTERWMNYCMDKYPKMFKREFIIHNTIDKEDLDAVAAAEVVTEKVTEVAAEKTEERENGADYSGEGEGGKSKGVGTVLRASSSSSSPNKSTELSTTSVSASASPPVSDTSSVCSETSETSKESEFNISFSQAPPPAIVEVGEEAGGVGEVGEADNGES